jgi:sugar O-acyltransferase (sialic acid O-acetyltransferase NeuD family)
MTKSNLILIGAGGHARSCIDVIEQQDYFQIAGLVGSPEQRDAQYADYGYAVIGADSDLFTLAKIYQYALIAIGQIQSAKHRVRLYQHVKQLGYQLPTIIAPTAYVSRHATIGEGSIVMHGAIVNAGAYIGTNCIINSRALIEHDARVGDHCHISTGAILNGGVSVGSESFIGSGSVTMHGITIGNGCIVDMGVSIRHNLADQTHLTGHQRHD